MSRGESPASFAPPPTNGKPIDFPRAEPMSAAPSMGGFERERVSTRGMSGPPPAPPADNRSRRTSDHDTEPYIPPRPVDKGKERQKSIYAPAEQSYAPSERDRDRATSYAPSERDRDSRAMSHAPSDRERDSRATSYAPSERERDSRATSYAPSERERDSRATSYAPSERERDRASYAPSERERERTSSFATDRSMAHSRNTSTTSRIGDTLRDTLTDTWGANKGSPLPSPIDPYNGSQPSVPATPASRGIPNIDTSSRGPGSRAPRDRTSSRISERGLSTGADPLQSESPALETVDEAHYAPPGALPVEEEPPADVGAGESWAEPPAPAAEVPVETLPEEPVVPAAPAKKGKKGKTATSKAASKAATPAAAAPKTPVERTRSNDWASLSATAPEPVVTSPVVGAEFNSFEDTFQLQDFSAKDKAKVITPSFEMSTPAEQAPQTEKSLLGAPSPPAETSSSWGSKMSGFGGA
ncbi:hypothetical protein FIBSPDRAFT_821028, partial [Athelia psychrophila]